MKSRGHGDPADSLKRRFDLGKPKGRKPRANINWVQKKTGETRVATLLAKFEENTESGTL